MFTNVGDVTEEVITEHCLPMWTKCPTLEMKCLKKKIMLITSSVLGTATSE